MSVPMVDRPDYVEGQIDALTDMLSVFEHRLEKHLDDIGVLEIREILDADNPDGNTPLQQYAADLDVGALMMGAAIRDALQHARWKLKRVAAMETGR